MKIIVINVLAAVLMFAGFCQLSAQNDVTLKDVDGNTYETVTIGTVVWMAENLKTTKYNDGSVIPLVSDGDAWSKLTSPGYCWYNNDIKNKNDYGALYNRYTVNSNKLCPAGWRLPSSGDWKSMIALYNYKSKDGWEFDSIGGMLKMADTLYWNSPNLSADNRLHFNAKGAGVRNGDGTFGLAGEMEFWWEVTNSAGGPFPVAWFIAYDTDKLYNDNYKYTLGFSVRCVKE